MTDREALSLRTGERIRLGRLASDPAGGFRAEVYTVSLVEVVAETRRVRVVTTSGLHFSPGQIERAEGEREEGPPRRRGWLARLMGRG